jgi:hypothetical protein
VAGSEAGLRTFFRAAGDIYQITADRGIGGERADGNGR